MGLNQLKTAADQLDTLPTRRTPLRVDGGQITAKSDWYWMAGANQWTADRLGEQTVQAEDNHERRAGLWCLALGVSLDNDSSNVSVVGDDNGVYALGDIHRSWDTDIRDAQKRLSVRHGSVCFHDAVTVWPEATRVVVHKASSEDDSSPSTAEDNESDELAEAADRAGLVRVRFTDPAGLTMAANPWLREIDFPALISLRGPACDVRARVTRFSGANGDHQCAIAPTVTWILKHLGMNTNVSATNSLECDGFLG